MIGDSKYTLHVYLATQVKCLTYVHIIMADLYHTYITLLINNKMPIKSACD